MTRMKVKRDISWRENIEKMEREGERERKRERERERDRREREREREREEREREMIRREKIESRDIGRERNRRWNVNRWREDNKIETG